MDWVYKVYRTKLPTAKEMVGEIKFSEQIIPNFDEHKIRSLFGIPESDGVELVLTCTSKGSINDRCSHAPVQIGLDSPSSFDLCCACCGKQYDPIVMFRVDIRIGLCRNLFHLCGGCMRIAEQQKGLPDDHQTRDGGAIVLARILVEKIKELGVGTIDKAGGH